MLLTRHLAAILTVLTVLTLYCLAGPARVRWALNTHFYWIRLD